MFHKDLEVWKQSIALVTDVYKASEQFPKSEIYGLTNQIRRCAVSIPSNIAEGAARNSQKETLHFIGISLGSVAELETQLVIASNLGYLSNNSELFTKLKQVNALLKGLHKSLINN